MSLGDNIMLYQRIREPREEKNLTQAAVGHEIHVSQSSYSYYENGVIMSPPEILCALADFYDVSVDYLLERTRERAAYPKEQGRRR